MNIKDLKLTKKKIDRFILFLIPLVITLGFMFLILNWLILPISDEDPINMKALKILAILGDMYISLNIILKVIFKIYFRLGFTDKEGNLK